MGNVEVLGFMQKPCVKIGQRIMQSGGDFKSVKQGASGNWVKGGYFLREVGREVQVHGVFQYSNGTMDLTSDSCFYIKKLEG